METLSTRYAAAEYAERAMSDEADRRARVEAERLALEPPYTSLRPNHMPVSDALTNEPRGRTTPRPRLDRRSGRQRQKPLRHSTFKTSYSTREQKTQVETSARPGRSLLRGRRGGKFNPDRVFDLEWARRQRRQAEACEAASAFHFSQKRAGRSSRRRGGSSRGASARCATRAASRPACWSAGQSSKTAPSAAAVSERALTF